MPILPPTPKALVLESSEPPSDPPPSDDDVAEIQARGAAELELERLRSKTTLTLGVVGLVGVSAVGVIVLAALGVAPIVPAMLILSNMITAGLAYVVGKNGNGKVLVQ